MEAKWALWYTYTRSAYRLHSIWYRAHDHTVHHFLGTNVFSTTNWRRTKLTQLRLQNLRKTTQFYVLFKWKFSKWNFRSKRKAMFECQVKLSKSLWELCLVFDNWHTMCAAIIGGCNESVTNWVWWPLSDAHFSCYFVHISHSISGLIYNQGKWFFSTVFFSSLLISTFIGRNVLAEHS